MSSPFVSETLRNAIAAAVLSAWAPEEIYFGAPREVVPLLPSAAIHLDSVQRISATVSRVRYEYSFSIVGRFAWPGDPTSTIEAAKTAKSNSLYAALITGSTFAGVADLHNVDSITYEEVDDPRQRAYEVRVAFTAQSESSRV
jgi:hypothetical protein